jgi:hypothetical protein
MLSIEEKQKIIRIKIKNYKNAIYELSSNTSIFIVGDPQIEKNALEYSNLINCIKALENELILLTSNTQQ